ncbi:hypothetical protein HMPREF0322_02828 [Desulfitobacterium hafniense DP7]|uniref:Uncharacterized protein n=1 Tax=Desulfitobacterium hafniense DP7 TaxID=537010 RepID=G9XPD2_DESHA|nr:hypothetical protein HMPREF0322_02828 [Desulfitobacterium hafniense DP7]
MEHEMMGVILPESILTNPLCYFLLNKGLTGFTCKSIMEIEQMFVFCDEKFKSIR